MISPRIKVNKNAGRSKALNRDRQGPLHPMDTSSASRNQMPVSINFTPEGRNRDGRDVVDVDMAGLSWLGGE